MTKTKVEIFASELVIELEKKGQREAENKFTLIIEENKLPLWVQLALRKEVAKLREKINQKD